MYTTYPLPRQQMGNHVTLDMNVVCGYFNDFQQGADYCSITKIHYFDTIVHFRYINITTWLQGFQNKLPYLVLNSLYPSLFWELRDKRNFKNLQF